MGGQQLREQLRLQLLLGGKNSSTGNLTCRKTSQGSSWLQSLPQSHSFSGMQ